MLSGGVLECARDREPGSRAFFGALHLTGRLSSELTPVARSETLALCLEPV